jgi:hypothetical protein
MAMPANIMAIILNIGRSLFPTKVTPFYKETKIRPARPTIFQIKSGISPKKILLNTPSIEKMKKMLKKTLLCVA